MPSCDACNRQTSTADLTVAIVSRWTYDIYPAESSDHHKLVTQVRRQAPELVAEWIATTPVMRKKARRHLTRHGVAVPFDAGIVSIGPLTIRQLNIFAHKATLALYFEHFKKPLSKYGIFCAYWKSKEDFAREGLPKDLLDLFPSYGTLIQGKWNESETFEYRHSINFDDNLFGFFAKLRRGLFVSGFALGDAKMLPENSSDWVRPGDLLSLVDTPRFTKKL